MMANFNDVAGGFAKQGRDLTENDKEAIRAFIQSHSISPSFVRSIVREHGDAPARAAFLLRDRGRAYALEYLLRRYKGSAFRKVYPNMSIVP
jgi:hypothetical protein